jgi:hypothetical protein
MKLKQPAAPFERLEFHGDSVSLDTSGKVLVLPSGNPDILPSHNEYVLNSNRLTIAESPFGGLKGPGSPDYAPGTLYTPTDGVYLTDLSGTNSTKTLTAGKLAELEDLSVDTTNHKITEEFVIQNDSLGSDIQVIDDGSSTTGWVNADGTGVISVDTGRLKVVGNAAANGKHSITISKNLDLSSKAFITVEIECTNACYLMFTMKSNTYYMGWSSGTTRFPIAANTRTKFVLPINAPSGSTGSNPDLRDASYSNASINQLYVGVIGLGSEVANTFYVDNIQACNGTWAQVEVAVPDNLSATSLSLYTHNGTAYQLCSTHSLDGAYSQVSKTSANCTFLDGTKLDDVYGTGAGRAVFPKGSAAATVNGSTGSLTYSENRGTDKRIGLKVDLPPSDNGRTNFNKCRIKTVISYAADSAGKYSASYQFSDTTSASTGLQNLSKPWIALYDPAKTEIDFYLFTYRPKNLEFKRDESGNIHELKLYPGNGQIYHGQITHCDLTRDTDSDLIPDILGRHPYHFVTADGAAYTTADGAYFDFSLLFDGSVTKFLEAYGMVI